MRIVYVLASLGIGGAERQTLTMAARMAARGHLVQVMVLRPLRGRMAHAASGHSSRHAQVAVERGRESAAGTALAAPRSRTWCTAMDSMPTSCAHPADHGQTGPDALISTVHNV